MPTIDAETMSHTIILPSLLTRMLFSFMCLCCVKEPGEITWDLFLMRHAATLDPGVYV